jgi:hypothetical protein
MLRSGSLIVFAIMLMMTVCFTTGCGQNTPKEGAKANDGGKTAEAGKKEYNPHDVPITEEQKAQLKEDAATMKGAVAKIKDFRNATEAETKDGIPENPYKAHQALDQADLVLQWLPQIARDSGVAKEHWEEINTTANDLRTLFEKVHQNIDNQKLPDFASVAAAIDRKIARLEEIAQAPTGQTKES